MTKVFYSATSYPRNHDDWQGIFIKRIADALAEAPAIEMRAWLPPGPLHEQVATATTPKDQSFLIRLSEVGGIAHLLRNHPLRGAIAGTELISRLGRAYRRNDAWADVFHVNWLQCALGLFGSTKPALVTVLGTDIALLKLPGMKAALRSALRGRKSVLCPNAEWMVPELSGSLGDACEDVECIPFGVDDAWFRIERQPAAKPKIWITVLRVTKAKIGPLFEWTRNLDHQDNEFHLFGPMQELVEVPSWIRYHGPATPEVLMHDWYPRATGMISLSQHDEGRPQVMLEALAAGVPLVASPIKAHTNLLGHMQTAVIVSSENEFQDALHVLSDPAQALQLSEAGRRKVAKDFGTWADCAARYSRLYSRLLQKSQ